MSKYLTRIELHNADQADYIKLHALMGKAGFSRVIEGSNGVQYNLPWAEYYCEGNFSTDAVLGAAKNAAKMTGRDSAVVTGQFTVLKWDGLTPVNK